MTPSDLERRLAALLHEHAEDAMHDTDTEERLETLLIGAEQDTRRRRRVWAAGALAAAAVTAAVIAWAPGLGGDGKEAAPDIATGTAYQAERVATRFVTAYASFDRTEAAGYLADSVAGFDGWRRENRWFEAVGFRMLLDPCRAQGESSSRDIRVVCPYDYDALRSDALARGPFTGSSFVATVRDGRIVTADLGLAYENNGFSARMWEPFAVWVSKNHPEDAADMYADWPSTTLAAHTPRSDRLWRRYSLEYVKHQRDVGLAPG